ncbi:ADP-dependent NAD(P)H-hydrate dehydratase [Aeriscardovia aeriphila]|uniref:ADP-dependent NAD(P)H-hydrate dehydratase n=1 Tax=Aeriscardovia aeriphila TaxID=218139 RepID=UPI00131489D9|nr:ADP/ATP-dependent (S)-NAD(P)H-hydrate dehydratase [Aeriscardovia aeriphila]NYI25437.1 NAD(P)H-hydrate repair Nnr-like enzyme with NAD(P)H-hydrate dehydratase domain [Aeriscardovia aeriphila]
MALLTGSERYPGAGILSASAACSAGAGYCRFWGPAQAQACLLLSHPELVFDDEESLTSVLSRVSCWVVGSGFAGLDASEPRFPLISQLFAQDYQCASSSAVVEAGALRAADSASASASEFASEYVVVDAGALLAFVEARKARKAGTSTEDSAPRFVITPHTGEMARVMTALTSERWTHQQVEEQPRQCAQYVADNLGCVVVLKGNTTYIAAPEEQYELSSPTTWLASAGTGDVLAGILGALIAHNSAKLRDGKVSLATVCATSVLLHSVAGALASRVITPESAVQLLRGDAELDDVAQLGQPLTASTVVDHIAQAYGVLLQARESVSGQE